MIERFYNLLTNRTIYKEDWERVSLNKREYEKGKKRNSSLNNSHKQFVCETTDLNSRKEVHHKGSEDDRPPS